jgi:hypothetical protein
VAAAAAAAASSDELSIMLRKLDNESHRRGLRIQHNDSLTNSLFVAFAQQLRRIADVRARREQHHANSAAAAAALQATDSAEQIRQRAADAVSEFAGHAKWWCGEYAIANVEEYANGLRSGSEWGDESTLALLAQCYQKRICVLVIETARQAVTMKGFSAIQQQQQRTTTTTTTWSEDDDDVVKLASVCAGGAYDMSLTK